MRAIDFPDRRLAGLAIRRLAVGAGAAGALALGAVAIGALAVGAFAIGRLSVRTARFDKVDIGDLTVRRLRLPDSRPQRQPSLLSHAASQGTSQRVVRPG